MSSLDHIETERNINLANFSHFKTGDKVENLLIPKSLNELIECILYFKTNNLEYKIVGATTNILFLDETSIKFLISTKKLANYDIDLSNMTASAECGLMLSKFVCNLIKNGIAGFEGLEGIPGTIGGGLFMNAGAYGCTISDYLISVDAIDSNGKKISLEKEELKFSYRSSIFRRDKDLIILKAYFKLQPGDQRNIEDKAKLFHTVRRKYNDYSYPSLGSTFATLDIYSDLAKNDIVYKISMKLIRKFFYSKKFAPHRRPANNKILNAFTEWYFKLNYKIQPYSDKTMNCIVNKSLPTEKYLNYIEDIKTLTRGQIEIENEII
jgi:UDP-N-acetylmuramate dehydrogenase